MTVIICSPQGWTWRTIRSCRKCKRRTQHLVTSYVWYDPLVYCLAHEPFKAPMLWGDAMSRKDAFSELMKAVKESIE